MSLAELLKRSYYELNLRIKQDREARLPYYGPIVRGWLGDAFYRDKMLLSVLFKNPDIDVRPFFFYTSKEGDIIMVNLRFVGFSEHFIKEVVVSLGEKEVSHLGGVDCRVEGIRYKERGFSSKMIEKRFRVDIISPIALFEEEEMQAAPSLKAIIRALVRQANKFTKYYVKDVYPIRVGEFKEGEVKEFEINSFFWRHRNIRGEVIPLRGVWGWVEYEVDEMTEEMKEVLGLADFFQIGKWVSYGFGKIEM